jgi:dUTPase
MFVLERVDRQARGTLRVIVVNNNTRPYEIRIGSQICELMLVPHLKVDVTRVRSVPMTRMQLNM